MSYQNWLTVSTVFIFIGAVLAAFGVYGQTHFRNKIEEIKEKQLTDKINNLLKGNEELKESIKPFEELAQKIFPDEDVKTALENLEKEISKLEKEHQKTYFKIKCL